MQITDRKDVGTYAMPIEVCSSLSHSLKESCGNRYKEICALHRAAKGYQNDQGLCSLGKEKGAVG